MALESDRVVPPASSPMLKLGLCVTVAYCGIVTLLIYIRGTSVDELRELELNSVGDLVAGVSAPLAFFWFVIAVLLQQRELELTRREFEMTRSVTASHAVEARRQAEAVIQQVDFLREQQDSALRAQNDQLYYTKLRRLEGEIASVDNSISVRYIQYGNKKDIPFGPEGQIRTLENFGGFAQMVIGLKERGDLQEVVQEGLFLRLLKLGRQARDAALIGTAVAQEHSDDNGIAKLAELYQAYIAPKAEESGYRRPRFGGLG